MTGQSVSTVLTLARCPATAGTAGCRRHSPGFLRHVTPAIGPTNSCLALSNVMFPAVPAANCFGRSPSPQHRQSGASLAPTLLAFTACFVCNYLSRKLAHTAPGGNAAFPTWPGNLLFTVTTKHMLEVDIDSPHGDALIDAGANISVMSSHLHRRLHKVIPPALSTIVRVTNGRTPNVAGLCTARVGTEGIKFQFYSPSQTPALMTLFLSVTFFLTTPPSSTVPSS